MRDNLVTYSIVGSLPCALACLLLTAFPEPLSGLCWCLFAGYCTTYLIHADFKKMPNVFSSYLVGIIWGFVFWYFFIWVEQFGFSFPMTMFIDVEVITAALLFVHLSILKNSWANIIAMLFPPIFMLFSCHADMSKYPYMIIALFLGSFSAIVTAPFTDFILGRKGKEK